MHDRSALHWQQTYQRRAIEDLSWTEAQPEVSLALIAEAGLAPDAAIVDVGGGASHLAAELLARGYRDVTVLDISPAALERSRADLGADADQVTWIAADIGHHDFGRRFDLWHDRALFHFMVEPAARAVYLAALERALRPGGHAILATFGPQGPTECSGLPVARYDAAAIADELGDEYTPVSSRLVEHRTPAGAAQQFTYAHLRRNASGRSRLSR